MTHITHLANIAEAHRSWAAGGSDYFKYSSALRFS